MDSEGWLMNTLPNTDQQHLQKFSYCRWRAVTLVVVVVAVVVKVLDALMNHLEETLEVVLSRGENLVLDNKVVK